MINNLEKLSKIVSHALRHSPEQYDIKLDDQGWVSLNDLADGLNRNGILTDKASIITMVDNSTKKRHQILDNRIRAYYGHSVNEKILKKDSTPPEFLYHGTIEGYLGGIKEKGLLPMNRQYVHLSIDTETAKIVGSRKKGQLAIIKIMAKKAFDDNVQFYKEENGIWLSEPIPSKYIVF